MKIHFDKKLLKYSIYVTLTAIAIFLALIILTNIGIIFTTIFSFISSGFNLIKPLLIAIIIAYLLFPLMKIFENFLRENKFLKVKKQGTRRIISILISYILIISIYGGLNEKDKYLYKKWFNSYYFNFIFTLYCCFI